MSHLDPSADLLKLTLDMLASAESGRWEDVGAIEAQRQIILKKIDLVIGNTSNENSLTDIKDRIQEVLSLNMRIIDLGKQAKTDLTSTINGLTQGRKAVNAYLR